MRFSKAQPTPGVFSMKENQRNYKANLCTTPWKHGIPYWSIGQKSHNVPSKHYSLCPVSGLSMLRNTISC